MNYALEEGYKWYSRYVNRIDKINLLKRIIKGKYFETFEWQRGLFSAWAKKDVFILHFFSSKQIVLIPFKGPKGE